MDDWILREATWKDCHCVWQWKNDPDALAVSLSSQPVPWEEHQIWFKKKLESLNSVLFIGEIDSQSFGVVRVDKQRVSINLAPEFRGKGLGYKLLSRVLKRYGDLEAEVKKDHHPSLKLFQSLGFEVVGDLGEFWQMKRRVDAVRC